MVGNHFGVDGSQFDLLLRGCEKGCEEDFSFEIELSLKSFFDGEFAWCGIGVW